VEYSYLGWCTYNGVSFWKLLLLPFVTSYYLAPDYYFLNDLSSCHVIRHVSIFSLESNRLGFLKLILILVPVGK
jgi:hypothetical protein